MTDKPPIGLIPEGLWIELHVRAIEAALLRYQIVGVRMHEEWATELDRHTASLESMGRLAVFREHFSAIKDRNEYWFEQY